MEKKMNILPLVRLRDEGAALAERSRELRTGIEAMITGRSISTASKIALFAEVAKSAWNVLGAYATHLAYDRTPANEIAREVKEAYRALKEGNIIQLHSLAAEMQKAKTPEGKKIADAVSSVVAELGAMMRIVEKDLSTYTPEERQAMAEAMGFLTPEGEIRFNYDLIRKMGDESATARSVQAGVESANAAQSREARPASSLGTQGELGLEYGGPKM